MKIILFLLLPFFGNAQSKTLKYEWRKISGPVQYKIESPKTAVTQITHLVEGTYQFELKVTNEFNLSTRDTMILKVKPETNKTLAMVGGRIIKDAKTKHKTNRIIRYL